MSVATDPWSQLLRLCLVHLFHDLAQGFHIQKHEFGQANGLEHASRAISRCLRTAGLHMGSHLQVKLLDVGRTSEKTMEGGCSGGLGSRPWFARFVRAASPTPGPRRPPKRVDHFTTQLGSSVSLPRDSHHLRRKGVAPLPVGPAHSTYVHNISMHVYSSGDCGPLAV